ncbi:hypothetical protein CPB85DRAFT_1436834 [Mucidula mucida]|nr:hypothetical protein CPB85DRAFT_1436834 [Mucidula mucida]
MINMRSAHLNLHSIRCILHRAQTPILPLRTVTTLIETKHVSAVSHPVPRFHPDGLHPERCNDEGWSEEDYMAMTQHGALYQLPERQLRYGGMKDYYTASEETQVLQVRTEEEHLNGGKDMKSA